MKIIISHDVDHLYATDHLVKDLILPKLWIRSFLHLCTKKITFRTFFYRLTVLFRNRMHRINEVMEFDRVHGIPSVFFFGMASVLGMSYSPQKAAPLIQYVKEQGFDVGVHGVDYQEYLNIKKEHDDFAELSGMESFGIRNHYVRFDSDTFQKMDQAGYLFDSTWFDKQKLQIRAPYKVGNLWEFPLHIMDVYICKPGQLKDGLQATFDAIQQADTMGMPYCTILFHDTGFNAELYPELKQWYEQTIQWIEDHGYQFISYRDAILELEESK